MRTLNLPANGFIGAETGLRLSFFNWVIRAHSGLRQDRAEHLPHARRIHLPDVVRVRAQRKAVAGVTAAYHHSLTPPQR